jgi:hypothetical protein
VFLARQREGTTSFHPKSTRTCVAALMTIAAVETYKNQLSRDFQCRPIFDFSTVSANRRHHSITSSARVSSIGGNVRPSALARWRTCPLRSSQAIAGRSTTSLYTVRTAGRLISCRGLFHGRGLRRLVGGVTPNVSPFRLHHPHRLMSLNAASCPLTYNSYCYYRTAHGGCRPPNADSLGIDRSLGDLRSGFQ